MIRPRFIAPASAGALASLGLISLGLAPAASARNREVHRAPRPAHAAAARAGDPNAVFVQSNQPSGNRVLVFDRATDGSLTAAGSYSTGGVGGTATPGTQSDHLASQGSLAYDADHHVLIAVNAGSNTVSSLRVHGDRLQLVSVVPAGGSFPASVTIHDGLVYVLDSGGRGTLQGYRLRGARLDPIPGSARSLGLDNANPPNFLTAPGQVGLTPDGGQLIVTTKKSGSAFDVFEVGPDGRLSATPVQTASATPVPFAFTFTPGGRLAAGEAGTSSLTTYALNPSGALTDPKSQTDGQTALCWIQRIGPFYYVSNTGSNTLAGFRIDRAGQPSLIGSTGVVASTEPGPIDLTSAPQTRFLYAETGGGTVEEFRVADDGTLTRLGAVGGLPVGLEGIAAS